MAIPELSTLETQIDQFLALHKTLTQELAQLKKENQELMAHTQLLEDSIACARNKVTSLLSKISEEGTTV